MHPSRSADEWAGREPRPSADGLHQLTHVKPEELFARGREPARLRARGRERRVEFAPAGLFLAVAVAMALTLRLAAPPRTGDAGDPGRRLRRRLAGEIRHRRRLRGADRAGPGADALPPADPARAAGRRAQLGPGAADRRGRRRGQRLAQPSTPSATAGTRSARRWSWSPPAPRPSAGTAGRSTSSRSLAQFVFDFATAAGAPADRRHPAVDGAAAGRPGLRARCGARPGRADGAVRRDQVGPGLVLLVVPLATVLAVLSRERRARVDQALELSEAYQGTAILLGDVVEADDAYTGSHSRGVVELSLAVSDHLGLGPRSAATSSSPPSSTTSARSPCRRRSSTRRARSTTTSGR